MLQKNEHCKWCSFFVMGRIVMCSKLPVWGYGQIAQIYEKGKMFVYIVHADNISDYVGF